MKKKSILIVCCVLILITALPLLTACNDDVATFTVTGYDGFNFVKIESATNEVAVYSYTGSAANVTVPSSIEYSGATYKVSEIAEGAFTSDGGIGNAENTALVSVTIPTSVKKIGNRAFYHCVALQTITFETGSTLESIGGFAFFACSKLTSVSLPASIKEIGSDAFAAAKALTSVILPCTSVPKIGDRAFKYRDGDDYKINQGFSISVPVGMKATYEAVQNSNRECRYWHDYTSAMTENA